METLISYFKLALNSVKNNYVNFSGRATRTEYFSVLVSILFLFIIAGILLIIPFFGTIIFVLYTLAVILPLLAVSARRLHDVGKPAWYILVPFGLGIVALVIAGIGYSSFSVGLLSFSQFLGALSALFNAYIAYLVVLPSDPASAYGKAENLPAPLKLEFLDAMKKVYIKNYLNFSGRAGRAEFWWPTYFFVFIYASLISFLNVIPFLGTAVSIIVSLAVIIPNIAVAVRRMHDINKSGFFVLIPYATLIISVIMIASAYSNVVSNPYSSYAALGLMIFLGVIITLAGWIFYFILTIRKGDETENRFGPVPDETDAKTVVISRTDGE